MSKYICKKCGNGAQHIDFINNDVDNAITAVYVYCLKCQLNAWGGVNFHPEMNNFLNKIFSPNFDYDINEINERFVLIKNYKKL